MTMNLHTQTTAPVAAQATSVSPLEPSGSSKTKGCKDKIRSKTDVYQTVTNSIIEALERGVKPWVCPWKHNGAVSGIPSNFSTGKAYTGMNIMLLWCSAAKHGFQDPRWLTYHQATEQGARIRKGETGTTGIFYKTLEKENDAGELERIPMLKTFTVFNIEQTDGLNLDDEISPQPVTEFDPLPEAEALFQRTGANFHERGQRAYYQPSTDEIWLPERHLFRDAANFYATGLHELVHWTGAESRLDREKGGKFGLESYAFEELIAELGCAFLMADLGVRGEVQHENYIASWLKSLKNDKRYIFQAASAASKAHRFLMAC
ncbi:zincin-like metallopeptidase domain-containing protein [Enterobacter bugandensis]|uniref:ArdC family protein n=1 Tax=Enterobacter bugandensis TaxID=881260 RepID=UPI0023AF2F32|nr:zincin-like metallopeptidase domain-containing protein [Enterobacter bugandensis]MDE7590846.1 zincin-like metallopeptidase domain-containing protein [Enterobacter bugandensis]